ncbi:hypothetical protein GQ43DRAFT_484079 [Delitschia confertaspora ATCC 74209]|uniref:HECT-type E3 ubiquitin transferase n=1 Tax=Delitschia confertaspora ATCC 74209 TaxID=1513339 RepID=A0A9P4MUZ8_9PLEO|nr:hypothetical protein GQ43DRAFT_484079 [Delitschia confertaspora ATCC 74209]
MTSFERESHKPQHVPYPITSLISQPLIGSLVTIQTPVRLLESARMQRQMRFEHLVRHYLSQVLYGCKNQLCTTRTCLSCKMRLATTPFRAPTQLTARSLAHYLAIQDDPFADLCPYELNVDPSALMFSEENWEVRAKDATEKYEHRNVPERFSANSVSIQPSNQYFIAASKRQQSKKDVKSLTQNLYDTITVIYSYSKRIEDPLPVRSWIPNAVEEVRNFQDDESSSPSGDTSKPVASVLPNGHKVQRSPAKNTLHSVRTDDFETLDGSGNQHPVQRQDGASTSTEHVPVTSHLTCNIMAALKKDAYHPLEPCKDQLSFAFDYHENSRLPPPRPFANRSLFYSLSDPATLLKSFRDGDTPLSSSPLPHLDRLGLIEAFKGWDRRNGALIFDSLWLATEALFIPPPELDTRKNSTLRRVRISPSQNEGSTPSSYFTEQKSQSVEYLDDGDAAHVIMICIHALTSLVPRGRRDTWLHIRGLRSRGVLLPLTQPPDDYRHSWLHITDALEYEPAVRLADRLVRGIAARKCFSEILQTLSTMDSEASASGSPRFDLMDILVRHLQAVEIDWERWERDQSDNWQRPQSGLSWTVSSVFVEWLKTIILKKWDCKDEVNRWCSAGAAMEVMAGLYEHKGSLRLSEDMFYVSYINERIDPIQSPASFLVQSSNPNTRHLFEYEFLFEPRHLMAFFRAINYASMCKQYERAEYTQRLMIELDPVLRHSWSRRLATWRLTETWTHYLVLNIRREHALEDALNTLWGLQRRQLLKPLKVRLGEEEGGEMGQDYGGVSLEFFQIVLKDIFNPDNGMFTIDAESQKTWFQPASLEPLWKFEMVGILFSLAVYNGITLPANFPSAFYTRLLGQPVTEIDQIRDGWKQLAESFDHLLKFQGDVADVYMRSYIFDFEAFGQRVHVDMGAIGRDDLWPADYDGQTVEWNISTTWPDTLALPSLGSPAWERPKPRGSPKPGSSTRIGNGLSSTSDESGGTTLEADMVTNENREKYVSDYIFWLTDKSIRPQFSAFKKGFYTCLSPSALHLFTPPQLQHVIEGSQDFSLSKIKAGVRYENGYSETHPTVLDFWSIVEGYNNADRQRLIEFVTACDRLPVTFERLFTVFRVSGDTERLPTSSTCFARLVLPEYGSKEVLREKLGVALRYSRGFGNV